MKVMIMASGNGSNAENIIKFCQKTSSIDVVGVISDHATAKVLERAQALNVSTWNFERESTREDHESQIIDLLIEKKIDYIFLAGYMRILSPFFIQHFERKIINIHPSLLPDYPGLNSYERAFQDEVREHGCSIHLVDSGVDTGEILMQKTYCRIDGENLRKFKKRGLELEHQLYREFLEDLEQKL